MAAACCLGLIECRGFFPFWCQFCFRQILFLKCIHFLLFLPRDSQLCRVQKERDSLYCVVCFTQISVCLSVCRCLSVSVCLSVCLSLSFCLSMCLSLSLSVCLSLSVSLSPCQSLSVSLCLRLSVCLCMSLSVSVSLSNPPIISECAETMWQLVLCCVFYIDLSLAVLVSVCLSVCLCFSVCLSLSVCLPPPSAYCAAYIILFKMYCSFLGRIVFLCAFQL